MADAFSIAFTFKILSIRIILHLILQATALLDFSTQHAFLHGKPVYNFVSPNPSGLGIMSSFPPWASAHSGWRSRSTPLPSTIVSTFTLGDLVFKLDNEAQAGTFFTMAFFRPNVVVIQNGEVLALTPEDAEGLVRLCLSSTEGGKGVYYRIHHQISCRAISVLQIPSITGGGDKDEAETQLIENRVYGFSKERRMLEDKTSLLPEPLWELLGLAVEAKSDSEEGDAAVLQRVQDITAGVKRINPLFP